MSFQVSPTIFHSQAEQLLSSSGLPVVDLLAKAHAKAAGFLDIKKRSLLSFLENYVSLLLQTGNTIYSPSFVFSILGRYLPEEKASLSLPIAFDVFADDVDEFLEGRHLVMAMKLNDNFFIAHSLHFPLSCGSSQGWHLYYGGPGSIASAAR